MRRFQLTTTLVFAAASLSAIANASTLVINNTQTLTNEALTNTGNPIIQITSTGNVTFTGASNSAQVQSSIGNNIDNQGTATFSSAGDFTSSAGYNILNESGATTNITSGAFGGGTLVNIEDTSGHVNISGGSFQSGDNTTGASDVLANGAAANVTVSNLGGTNGPTFVTQTAGVDFLSENNGTIVITGPAGATFSDTTISGPFNFTGDLSAGSGTFWETVGRTVTAYTYDITSGGSISLGAPGATPEPLSSTTLGLGVLGIGLLALKSRRKTKGLC